MILAAIALLACTRIGQVVPENDVHDAELIVRVTAVETTSRAIQTSTP